MDLESLTSKEPQVHVSIETWMKLVPSTLAFNVKHLPNGSVIEYFTCPLDNALASYQVKNKFAFVHSDVEEDIYIETPQGFAIREEFKS